MRGEAASAGNSVGSSFLPAESTSARLATHDTETGSNLRVNLYCNRMKSALVQ